MLITVSLDIDAATRAYLATVNGVARAKSDAYFKGGYWLTLWNAMATIAAAWLVLRLGWAARLSSWASRITRGRKWLTTLIWAVVFLTSRRRSRAGRDQLRPRLDYRGLSPLRSHHRRTPTTQ